MKNSLHMRSLISSIVATLMLLYFFTDSQNPKIIFIPFLICSLSMIGKSIAQIMSKKKLELIFGKIFVLGFLLFFIGFLVVATFLSIKDRNYGLLIFSIPFWLIGIFLLKNKFFNKKSEKDEESSLTFIILMSGLLVLIGLLVGIFLLIFGFKQSNLGIIFSGVIFTFGSFAFVLAALTLKGCFEHLKIDVLGLYAGVVIAVIGAGFILLKFMETYSVSETIQAFGLWIIIPIMMTVVGIYQVIKCIRNKE